MKKLCVLLAFLMFIPLFCSCGSADHSEAIKEQFTAPFEYKVQTDEFEFNYKKEPDKVTMTVTNPATLEGLVLEKTASGVKASYDGLVVTLPSAAAEKLFALDTLVDSVLKAIEKGTFAAETADGQSVLTVTDGDYVYKVYYDPSADLITGAEVSEGEDKITYTFIQ
jgi:hypothetical protein